MSHDIARMRVTVVRILAHTHVAIWPDDYGDMTLSEVLAHEQKTDHVHDFLATEGKLSTTVTTTELPEE